MEFCRDLWHRKTRVPGLSYGVVSVILGLAIFVQLQLVRDRQTDRQTDGQTTTANTVIAQCCKVTKMRKFGVHPRFQIMGALTTSVSSPSSSLLFHYLPSLFSLSLPSLLVSKMTHCVSSGMLNPIHSPPSFPIPSILLFPFPPTLSLHPLHMPSPIQLGSLGSTVSFCSGATKSPVDKWFLEHSQ